MRRTRSDHAVAERLEFRRLLSGYPFSVGGVGLDAVTAVAPTADGGVVVAGIFSATADFQPGSGRTTLTAAGDTDVFVARYTPRGKLLWVHQVTGDYRNENLDDFPERDVPANPRRLEDFAGGVGSQMFGQGEFAHDVAVGPDGSVVLVGAFYGRANFDPGGTNTTLTASTAFGFDVTDFPDAYVMKLTADGQFVYAHGFGGPFLDAALGVAIDADNNPVVSGYFNRFADFNPGAAVFEVVARGRDDAFVMKLSTRGRLAWLTTAGGQDAERSQRESANDVAIDHEGNLYVTGTLANDAYFNPRPGGIAGRKAGGWTDLYVASYTPDGAFRWVQRVGTPDEFAGGSAIAVAGDAVYVAGYYTAAIDADPGRGVTTLVATGKSLGDTDSLFSDVAIWRFDRSNGAFRWVAPLRGTGYELVDSLQATVNGVTAAGSFYGSADFDPSRGQFVVNSVRGPGKAAFDWDPSDRDRADSYDGFAWQLSAGGKLLRVDSFGSDADDHVGGLALLPGGSMAYLGGRVIGRQVPLNGIGGRVSSVGQEDGLVTQLALFSA